MANQTITQLPNAGPITGTELVPIVQNGGTYKTTTAAIAGSPSQTQTFLTEAQELTLPNSRYLSTDAGLGLTDGGALSYYRISLQGAPASLYSVGSGIIVKDSGSTVAARTLQTSGAGIGISNADGTGGNPTFQLTGVAAAVANLGGTGIMAIQGGTTVGGVQILGTANQINVANGNGVGNPTVSIASNPVIPGTGSMTVPTGNNTQQPVGGQGQLRFNTDTQTFDGFANGSWKSFLLSGGVTSFSAGSTGLTPSAPTIGAVVLGGTLNVANGGTGAASLTGYVKGNGTSAMTASPTVPTTDLSGTVSNAQIANPQVTVNGTTIALGASGTITATASNPLTIGTGLSGTSYNGSTPVTIAIANTGVSANSYGAANKTLTATVNAQGQLTALADTPIAIANTQVSGLGTMSTQNASSVAITGGSINGTTIGASTPAAGTFTSLTTTTGTISTTPTNNTDIANKLYVDNVAAVGLSYHDAVQAATTQSLAAQTGGTVTYNNGAAGVGATLTLSVPLTTLDGYSLANTNRVLVKNETNQAYNGVYTWATGGTVLTRATDADTYGSGANQLSQNDYFYVQNGTVNKGIAYVVTTQGTIVFGTTAITFAEFSSSQIYSAGTGLTLTGTTFSITNTGVTASTYGSASSVPTLAINAQGQITSASNTPIAINANQITSGAVTNAQLQNSSVTVNGTAISLGGSGTITATATSALTVGAGLTGTSYNGSAPVTIALATSGVTPATYGSASQVPVFAVDTYGRVTSVTDTAIAISAGAVSGLAPSATTDTTNAANITSGTLPTGRISGSYTGLTGVGTLTTGTWNASTIGIGYGGTGVTATPTNGQLLIGNGAGYTLSTLTAGTNVFINNTAGGITISASASAGGTVTSVDVSGGTTGLTTSGGPVTSSGTITLGGTLNVANGGTGATTLTGYLKGNGTSAFSASATIPSSDITGLGSMATQNANNVAITGGAIDGTPIGATTASTVRGTTITATTQFSGPGTGLTGTASGLSIGGSASSATTATTATNIAGGTAGALAYNSAAGTTTFLSLGTTNFVLTAGATAPQYVAQSTLSVGSATTATTATNIAGGAANQIPYQTGAGATSFITAPSVTSTYLQWNGTAFVWATAGTGSVTSVNVSGGTTGLTFSGGPVTTSGTITMAGTLAIANGGTNATATPTAGAVSYGTGTAYAFTAAGTSGQVLTSAGASAPTWTSQGSLAVGTATNISGGAAGSVPYQSASSTTAFLAAGTTGQVLTSGGAGAPTWTTATSANTASAIVQRDASGNFNAGTITATLSGNATNVTGTVAVTNGGTGQTTYTNGQLLIGNTTGNTLTKATLTGTANQITVTNGAGSITLSGPQDLATTSSPTFANLNLGSSGSSQLNLIGYNAYGGVGIHGFLTVSNTYVSATNPNKYFRLTSAGAIEIVNSAYTAVIFTFDNSGNFTAAANVTAYSDERVKKNWRGLGNNFLEKLSNVKSGVFDRTDVELTQVGVSAQSLQEVMPEAVHTDEEDKLSVSYGNAALAACIELAKEVVALRGRVEALEGAH